MFLFDIEILVDYFVCFIKVKFNLKIFILNGGYVFLKNK